MAKDINDNKTMEIVLTLSQADALAMKAAIHTQLKSLERAARAQTSQNRTAMAEIYTAEANALAQIGLRLR